jgi:hypothetical protein
MLRKLSLALVATVALAGASLSSTAASAAWHGGHHGGWHGGGWHHGGGWGGPRLGFGFYPGYAYAYGPGCYIQRRYVRTRFGLRLRRVRVCY